MSLVNRLSRGRRRAHEPGHSQYGEHCVHHQGRRHDDHDHESRGGRAARAGDSVIAEIHSAPRSQRPGIALGIRTGQAAALAAASGLLLAACGGGGSSQASPSTAVSSTAAASGTSARQASADGTFCGAARRFGNDQQTFARYAKKEPASVTAKVLRVAKDAERALGEMRRLAPARLTADVKVYESTEKPIVDVLVANGGQLKQAIKAGDERGSPKLGRRLQRALVGIGNNCGFPGSRLMPMPKGMKMKGKGEGEG
jgi:hypothetical protein